MSVLKAAFICDIVRCGTLLWAPGTNHVGFKGLYPGFGDHRLPAPSAEPQDRHARHDGVVVADRR